MRGRPGENPVKRGGGEKAIYDNVGHKVEREAPEALARDMRAFFADIGYGPAS